MCPLWPLHYLVLYAIMLWPLLMLSCGVAAQLAGTKVSHWAAAAATPGPSPLYCAPPAFSGGHLDARFDKLLANGSLVDVYDPKKGLEIKIDETASLKFNTSDIQPVSVPATALQRGLRGSYSGPVRLTSTRCALPVGQADVDDGELYMEVANLEQDQDGVAFSSPDSYSIKSLGLGGPSWSGVFNVTGTFLGDRPLQPLLTCLLTHFQHVSQFSYPNEFRTLKTKIIFQARCMFGSACTRRAMPAPGRTATVTASPW